MSDYDPHAHENQTDHVHSEEYFAIYGVQDYGGRSSVHTFAANLSVDKVLKNKDIRLVEDAGGYSRWSLNRVIQRNISEERVQRIVHEYLQNPNRPTKFFPGITVVIVPVVDDIPTSYYRSKAENGSSSGLHSIDGLTITPLNTSQSLKPFAPVNLKWDKTCLSAYVVDGQHRVRALRQLAETISSQQLLSWSIPTSFVIFDNTTELDLVRATRRLFIDVNNTPRLVSEQRLVFIDDSNLHRRFTAAVLGIRSSKQEPYAFLDEEYKLDFDQSTDESAYPFLSRHLVREEPSDDQNTNRFLVNHDTLLPWEVTHIVTLHDALIGGVLFSRELGGNSDIRSFCEYVNDRQTKNLERESEPEQLPTNSKIRQNLRAVEASESEVELFIRLKDLRQVYLEGLSPDEQAENLGSNGADSSAGTDLDDVHDSQINKLQYDSSCQEDYAKTFQSEKVDEIYATSSLGRLIERAIEFWRSLWFVRGVYEAFFAVANEHKHENGFEVLFSLILSFEIKPVTKRTSEVQIRKRFISEYNANRTQEDHNADEIVDKFLNKVKELNPEENLCRTVVGQQMLFILFAQYVHQSQSELVKAVNTLGDEGFFKKQYAVNIQIERWSLSKYALWSEVLVRVDDTKVKMRPGSASASKAAALVKLILSNTALRKDARLEEFNRASKAVGSGVYSYLQNDLSLTDHSIAEEVSKLSDENRLPHYRKYLSEKEAERLSQGLVTVVDSEQTFKQSGILSVLKKYLGARALEKIVPKVHKKIEKN